MKDVNHFMKKWQNLTWYIIITVNIIPVVQILLVHCGHEHTVNAAYINNSLGNPLLLRRFVSCKCIVTFAVDL